MSESSPSLLSDDVYVPGTAYVVQQDGWCEERCLDGGRDELRWLRMRSNSSSSLLSIVRYCWKHALLQAPTDGTDSANGAPARRSETRVRRASRALVGPLARRGKDFMARRAWGASEDPKRASPLPHPVGRPSNAARTARPGFEIRVHDCAHDYARACEHDDDGPLPEAFASDPIGDIQLSDIGPWVILAPRGVLLAAERGTFHRRRLLWRYHTVAYLRVDRRSYGSPACRV